MKLVVFSDSHGNIDAFNQMLQAEGSYDAIYCLGDSGFSKSFLSNHNIISVKGNYPFGPKLPLEIIKKIVNYNFFLTHGHLYGVKFTLNRLINKANILRADICIFGHTHQAYLRKTNQLILLNPGALSYNKSSNGPSYSRIYLTDNSINIEIVSLNNKTILFSI